MNLKETILINPTLKLSKKETFFLLFLFIAIAIISNIAPFYALISLLTFAILIIAISHPKQAFFGTGILLIFQTAIARNMTNLGNPENLVNIIKRIDEFVWIFFLIFVILYNFKYKTWEFKKTNLDIAIIAFASLGITSALINHNSLFWSLIAIFLTLKGFIMYWLSINLKLKWKNVKCFFEILLYVLAFAAIVGILQFFRVPFTSFGFSERLGVSVSHSIFGHHGIFGFLMATGCALTIGLFMASKRKKWLLISIILFIGLISSSQRSSFIGLLAGIIWMLINSKKFEISKKHMYISIIFLILGICVFGGRLKKITKGTEVEYGIATSPRYWLYYGGIKIFKNKPLLGEGPGKYGSFISVITKSEIYEEYNIPIYDENATTDTYWPYILGEYGIFGVLIIFTALLILFHHLHKNFPNKSKNNFLKGLYIGYNILFVIYAAGSLIDQVYQNSINAFILFVGIGILTGTDNKKMNKIGKK